MISKMKHFRLSIGVLSLLLTVSVFAQNRSGKVVTGIVYEGDTETPLEAVVCTAEPSGAYAMTGADGRFSISVAKADNLIRFSLLGYTESAIPASGTDVVVRLYEEAGLAVEWEMNPGNHFRDAEVRTAKGIRAILDQAHPAGGWTDRPDAW